MATRPWYKDGNLFHPNAPEHSFTNARQMLTKAAIIGGCVAFTLIGAFLLLINIGDSVSIFSILDLVHVPRRRLRVISAVLGVVTGILWIVAAWAIYNKRSVSMVVSTAGIALLLTIAFTVLEIFQEFSTRQLV